jgi:hypothetical protein
MGAIARVFSRVFAFTDFETDTLKQLLLFGFTGLLVSVVLMTRGLDLSPGFF